jgi:hypothetical protein
VTAGNGVSDHQAPEHTCETCAAIDEIVVAVRLEGTDDEVPVLSDEAKDLLLGLWKAQQMFGWGEDRRADS